MRRIVFVIIFASIGSLGAWAQQGISGTVTDQQGRPVPAATIKIKDDNNQAIADSNGVFSLPSIPPLPFTMEISSAGFNTHEIVVTDLKKLTSQFILVNNNELTEVVITSRRRLETAQSVPIAISVITGKQAEDAGAFNVNRLKELVPSVQLYSSNPRNTTLNIRGMGSTFGLTNDGIDPGVGFYIDGVYYARPAATALDFVDVDRIEVLRGPQGNLFGKNTTAGAFNITSRAPGTTPGATFEVSYGNFGFIQAKTSFTGPLTKNKKLTGRLSFSGTQRNGLLYNTISQKHINDLNNLGFRTQLQYRPTEKLKITFIGDITDQKPDGYAQVVAGVVKTQRPEYRQFNAIIADLNYRLPTSNPFDRIVDHNTPWRSGNQLGGTSLNVDYKIGSGTLTSTTAWRYWNWDPSNDRDFTALPVLTLSQATSKHQQFTQEIRYAGDFSQKLNGVIGAFLIDQDLKTDPYHIEESGSAQWRFSQSTSSNLWKTPGLFDGYGIRTNSRLQTFGAALFGQLEWAVSDRFFVMPGVRFNYDKKDVEFDRKTYGGLQTTDPALLALKRLVYTDQFFTANVEETNFSGGLTLAYKIEKKFNAFATYSISYKPVGVNLGGLPTSNGAVMLELARIKPEYVNHWEMGAKTNPTKNSTFNVVFHHTAIEDYQTLVQSPEIGVNRGYLANAEKVRVFGFETDGNLRVNKHLWLYGNLAYTIAEYQQFSNAPVPLEETGSTKSFKDISGNRMPGVSKWAGSIGGELTSNTRKALGNSGKLFFAMDSYVRSEFSSSPSPSKYLNVPGYATFNTRFGFRADEGLSLFAWARNIFNKNYFEQLLPAAGNAGHYAAVLGDPRTFGITARYTF
jgi:iron complex outermembrane receptor protein